MPNKFYLFSKKSCGPCALVDKYFKSIKVDTSMVEKIDLEDFSDVPIPQENLDLAKKYGVTATPVLIITNADGEKLEERVGGMGITQNIRKLVEQYVE
jgi:thioredoxin-related protein